MTEPDLKWRPLSRPRSWWWAMLAVTALPAALAWLLGARSGFIALSMASPWMGAAIAEAFVAVVLWRARRRWRSSDSPRAGVLVVSATVPLDRDSLRCLVCGATVECWTNEHRFGYVDRDERACGSCGALRNTETGKKE